MSESPGWSLLPPAEPGYYWAAFLLTDAEEGPSLPIVIRIDEVKRLSLPGEEGFLSPYQAFDFAWWEAQIPYPTLSPPEVKRA